MAIASGERFDQHLAILDRGERTSFAGVVDEMLKVGSSLISRRVQTGDRVALWAPNSAAWITSALGVLAAGAWLVPLNTRFRGEEAAYILDRTDAAALFAPASFLGTDYVGLLRRAAPHLRALSNIIEVPSPESSASAQWSQFLQEGDDSTSRKLLARIEAGRAEDIADVIFTSGTTGRPKGVLLRHGASLRAYLDWNDGFRLTPGDRHLIVPPFFHCFGYKAGWMVDLMVGATAAPVAIFNADDVLERIARERITHISGPPTLFSALLDHPRRSSLDLSSLRSALVGAANIPPTLVHRLREELALDIVMAGYGLSESHGLVSFTRPDDGADVVATTVGRPCPDTEVAVVDPQGDPAMSTESNEIVIRGYTVMSGYYGDSASTSSAIGVDGWLHTGDIGHFDDDGYLHVTDRLKDIFIVGGFNVSPAEVERTLASMPGVTQVAVIGIPDDRLGEVGAAFVIRAMDATFSSEDVIMFAKDRLSNFKVPRVVNIVDALPINAGGKVDKSELRRRCLPSPDVPRP